MAQGSVRQLGVAHHGLGEVEALLEAAKTAKPVVNMIELHPLCSQRKLVGQLLRKVLPPHPHIVTAFCHPRPSLYYLPSQVRAVFSHMCMWSMCCGRGACMAVHTRQTCHGLRTAAGRGSTTRLGSSGLIT